MLFRSFNIESKLKKNKNHYHIHIPFRYNYPIIIYSMFRLIYLVEFDPPTQIIIPVPKISYSHMDILRYYFDWDIISLNINTDMIY